MADLNHLNRIIKSYFEKNKDVVMVAAKDLMPEFIKAGVFNKGHRNGFPIRKVLRDLNAKNELHLIPFAHGVQKAKNINWFFIPSDKSLAKAPIVATRTNKTHPKPTNTSNKKDKDEDYIIDLCNEVLGVPASRQHRFGFLLGDLHSNGVSRTKLPVDAYYASLNLVVEFHERQHTEAVSHFDKPNKMTVSGMHRGEQRAKYEQLRRDILPQHGIQLLEIDYSSFEVNGRKKLVRDIKQDKKVLTEVLKKENIL